MNYPRASILASLLSLIQTSSIAGSPAFITLSRKFQTYDTTPATEQPAGFLRQVIEVASQDTFGQTTWTLHTQLWVYCQRSPDSSTVPDEALDNVLDALETSLLPPVGEKQTLGGTVVHCYIDGATIIDEGSLPTDLQAVAVVPITVITGI